MSSLISIPSISFDMPITDLIMELEQLRYKEFTDRTNPLIFNQIRDIFQLLESVGSSRIEGNNTTIMDYVENTRISPEPTTTTVQEQIKEILNIENAMSFIEENVDDLIISSMLVRELHQLTVQDLSFKKEGAAHPGCFRQQNVRISGSSHTPPDYTQVPALMQDLMDFILRNDPPKYDLLKIAIAHHRFVWIHPFENGNGRVVRLFTYALLLKNVFRSKERIINPTAVFCSDRSAYYANLSRADNEGDEGTIAWAQYMLEGLKSEIVKIDKLNSISNLNTIVILPALEDALSRKFITKEEYLCLRKGIELPKQIFQSADIAKVLPGFSPSERSRLIKRLLDNGLIAQVTPNSRKYYVRFINNYLMRSVLRILDKEGFLPHYAVGDTSDTLLI